MKIINIFTRWVTTKKRKRVTINEKHRIIEVETELLYVGHCGLVFCACTTIFYGSYCFVGLWVNLETITIQSIFYMRNVNKSQQQQSCRLLRGYSAETQKLNFWKINNFFSIFKKYKSWLLIMRWQHNASKRRRKATKHTQFVKLTMWLGWWLQ